MPQENVKLAARIYEPWSTSKEELLARMSTDALDETLDGIDPD